VKKLLIVNADDYGYFPSFDKGIIECINAGSVTSTTALVKNKNLNPRLIDKLDVGIGLHLDLKNIGKQELGSAVEEQFYVFEKVFSRLPTHIDFHKFSDERKEVIDYVSDFALEKSLPVRSKDFKTRDLLKKKGVQTPDAFINSLNLSVEEIILSLGSLDNGVTELMVHPGYFGAESKSSLNREREEKDLKMLLSSEFKEAVNDSEIVLSDFSCLV